MLNLAGRYNFTKSDYYARQHRYTVHLGVGHFVTDRLAVGVQAESERGLYDYRKPGSRTQYVNRTIYRKNRLGAMARYYFRPGKKTSFFLQANAGYKQEYSEYEWVDEAIQQNSTHRRNYPNELYLSVTPGFAWFPARRVAVELSALTFGYSHQLNGPAQTRARKFGFMDGLNPKLGVTILLGGGRPAAPLPE